MLRISMTSPAVHASFISWFENSVRRSLLKIPDSVHHSQHEFLAKVHSSSTLRNRVAFDVIISMVHTDTLIRPPKSRHTKKSPWPPIRPAGRSFHRPSRALRTIVILVHEQLAKGGVNLTGSKLSTFGPPKDTDGV